MNTLYAWINDHNDVGLPPGIDELDKLRKKY